MYHVTIQFPSMRGRLTDDKKETLSQVAGRLAALLREHDGGTISRVKNRPDEPAALRLSVSNKAFVEDELIGALDDIGALSEAAVFYEGPDKRNVQAPR